jgi:hypothetical protein
MSARRENIKVDCYEIKTLYLIFGGKERITCMAATIALCVSKGNKESTEKTMRVKNYVIYPPLVL